MQTNPGSHRVLRRDRAERRRGTAIIEFAFAWTTFFLIAIVGIMDFGRAIWAYNALAHASHEAVRHAIVRGSDSLTPATETSIRDFVHSRIVMLNPSGVEVDVSWEDDNSPGNVVQVQASHTFQPLMGFMLPDIELSSTARMVITQ